MSMQKSITLTLQSTVEEIYQCHPSITKEIQRKATKDPNNPSVACSICYLELILNSRIPDRLIMKRRSVRRHYELVHHEQYDIIPKILNVFFYAIDDNGNIYNNIHIVDELYDLFGRQRQLMVEAEKKKKQKKKLKANQSITSFFGKTGDDKKEEETIDDEEDINHSLPSHDNDIIVPSQDNDDNNNRNYAEDNDDFGDHILLQSQNNNILLQSQDIMDNDIDINHNNNYRKRKLNALDKANAPQAATESKQKKMAQRDQDRYHKEGGKFEMESVSGDGLSKHHHNEKTILKIAFKCVEAGKNPFCNESTKIISPVMDRCNDATKPFVSTIADHHIMI